MGKLSEEKLERLLSYIKEDSRVIVPPLLGFDSGVHLVDDKYLVVSTDPCVGVPQEWFGWLLIHYVASDIALFGAKPEFCTINLLGSPSTRPQTFYRIMEKACDAADELGMAVVTGHTGTYKGISTIVGVSTAYGTVARDKLITPGGAKPGDYILYTKCLGLETVVNFALTHIALAETLFGVEQAQKLSRLVSLQSCVKEALLFAETGGVHAMHDATEGGLTAALNEMSKASKVGFRIEKDKIRISKEAYALKESYQLSEEQVLSMSSTGTVLAAVSPDAKNRAEEVLRQNNVEARALGVFTKDLRRILIVNGEERPFPETTDDPYERILSGEL